MTLRRSLLLWLGSLVALLVASGFCAIIVLNAVLRDLSAVTATAARRTTESSAVVASMARVQRELKVVEAAGSARPRLDPLLQAMVDLDESVQRWDAGGGPRLGGALAVLEQRVGTAIASEREPSAGAIAAAVAAADDLQHAAISAGNAAHAGDQRQQTRVTLRFRWTVLGIGVAFLLVLNGSILVLLRAATLIIHPVERLVEASRELAAERFEHRVHLDRRDEFGELAMATNHLAEQLQRNEQRKMETLQQVARTLSHELNNAMSIIELQVQLVSREGGEELRRGGHLGQIREALRRMQQTVGALTRVRRIVLTDYIAGVKMLDLKRSIEEDDAAVPPQPAAPASGALPSAGSTA